jgi:hypothetical protein
MSPDAPTTRARAHLRAITAMWAWQAVMAVLAAWPAASLVRTAYAGDPRGDAALWEPGGLALLDLLWHAMGAVTATADGALLVLIVTAVAGWVPLAALMVALARPHGRTSAPLVFYKALRVLPAFAKGALLVLAAQVATIGVGAFLGQLAQGWTRPHYGEAPAQLLEIAVFIPFGLAALGLGVAHDLARATIVIRGADMVTALVEGFRLLRRSSLVLSGAWAWRAAASLVPIAAAAWVASHLGRGTAALLAVTLTHQGAAFLRVVLRASWLARALRAARSALVRRLSPR